jgi:hypothetical protein
MRTGPALVESALKLGNIRVIYKPHPFTGTVSRAAVAADAKIRALLGKTGEHQVVVGAAPTLFDCFNQADILVADISSVLSDFISSEKPYIVPNLTGMSEEAFKETFPSAGQAYLLDPGVAGIGAILELVRTVDPLRGPRVELKHYLLGPSEPSAMDRFRAATDATYDLAVRLNPTRIAAGREQ